MTTTAKPRPSKTKAPTAKSATKPRATKPKAEPTPPAPTFGGSLTIDVALLKKIIAVVAPAASTDEARPMLTQMRVEPNGEHTDFAATDSYRLHNVTATVECAADSAPVNLPAWWLTRWARTKYSRSAKATIAWTERTATISVDEGDVTETVRLFVDGTAYAREYPSWRPMIDKVDDGTQRFAPAAFNPSYLAAALAACGRWSASYAPVVLDPLKPCLFVVRHPDNGTARILLMPVRSTDTAPLAS